MKTPSAAAAVALLLIFVVRCPAAESAPSIGLYVAPSSTWPADSIDALARSLAAAGSVVRLDSSTIAGPLDPARYRLIAVADAARVPAELPDALAAYAAQGGHLALLGGPFFKETLCSYGTDLLDRQQLVEAVAGDVQPGVLLDFESPQFAPWQNHSDRRSPESTSERVEGGAAGTAGALKLRASAEAGWDTFQSPPLDSPPAPSALLATLWAKGDGPQSQLVIEWRERDGSRWMATLRLSEQWRHYVLPVEAFRYWHDAAVQGRGDQGDRLHPENAATVIFGLAQSHAAYAGGTGHRTICIDQVGFASPPPSLRQTADLLPGDMRLPVVETVSPAYKLFPVTGATHLRVNPAQQIAPQIDLPEPSAIFAPTARPDGTGLDRGRPGRFVSLIEGLDEHGQPQVSPASLLVPSDPAHGLVLSVPIADARFFGHPAVSRWIGNTVERMLGGPFLLEGGAKYYASFGNEEMPLGALVVNRGTQPVSARVEITVADRAGQALFTQSWTVAVQPGGQQRVAQPWAIPHEENGPFRVSVRLYQADLPVDQLEHTLRVWRPNPSPQFVAARDGDLVLGDRPWRAHGVNYMPSSGAACEDQETFEYWMDGRAYGQEIIRRDLANLKAIGLNSVSVFVYHRSHADRNLLDFLMQCEEFGLKVNLSLRPGTPLDFHGDQVREMIVANRLAENDTIFAYDLAWEPMWGNRPQRRQFDPAWRAWIQRRYGDVAKAHAAWQFTPAREEGELVGPDDTQIVRDGPWRNMVLDYRRFLNETLDQAYRKARRLVRTVDTNHLVSFRMTIAGDPTTDPARMAYDPAGLAGAVDLMEPEGYGRIGPWDKVRPGWFTVAYCRAVAPKLPVVWAEFGYSVWDTGLAAPSPDRLEFAGRFYDDFLRMASQSGSNGTFCWFSCGGYRVNEQSDYGILAPDGTWRPQAQTLHRWAESVTAEPARKPVSRWIDIQLERDVDGVAGIYRRVGDQFWKAVDEGQSPGLRVEPAR